MKEFVLTYGAQQTLTVGVEEKSSSVEITVQGEKFTFTKHDLATAAMHVRREAGELLVSGSGLQRSFGFKPKAQGAGGEDAHAQNQLSALFPGKVVKLLAREKTWAQPGDLLIVMESMKMEYAYRAPAKVYIEKVLVTEGQVLSKGQEFFEVKAA